MELIKVGNEMISDEINAAVELAEQRKSWANSFVADMDEDRKTTSKQQTLLDDAMVVHHLVRAPERPVFRGKFQEPSTRRVSYREIMDKIMEEIDMAYFTARFAILKENTITDDELTLFQG